MDELYLFWNAFNLIIILTLAIGSGLLIGSGVSIAISIVTQVNDPAVAFFSKISGCLLGTYFMAPFILGSIKTFSEKLWAGKDLFQ